MKNCLIILLLTFICRVEAQIVSNSTELQNAISNAQPGTVIELSDGTWSDIQLSINVNATDSQPCIIRAINPGNVFFEGRTNISLGGSYIIFEGVVFQNASGLITSNGRIEPIIEFRDTSNNDCTNCTVRNIKVDSYKYLLKIASNANLNTDIYSLYQIIHNSYVRRKLISASEICDWKCSPIC